MAKERNIYTSLWSKYRPVILQLMSNSIHGPQHYKLFGHEFKTFGSKEKGGYSFLFEAANGKALKSIQDSAVASDLLSVLQQSPKAQQLMSEATYEFKLDKQFVLHVNRKEEKHAEVDI